MPYNTIINKLEEDKRIEKLDFYYLVDVSKLSPQQNKEFPLAILIGKVLSRPYINKVASNPNYVEDMKRKCAVFQDEFYLSELGIDNLADELASFIEKQGYRAYSQSERNIEKTGFYNSEQKSTPLPNKTIAVMAGLGWVGKHNVMVTPQYGSAISMCSVLTNLPYDNIMDIELKTPSCGNCNVCAERCEPGAIKGQNWNYNLSREDIVDVSKCTTCFQCVVHCPWTQKYIRQN